jgi:hypothetical protein
LDTFPGTYTSEVKATITALAYLELYHYKFKSEWELLKKKAIAWIKSQLQNEDAAALLENGKRLWQGISTSTPLASHQIGKPTPAPKILDEDSELAALEASML